MYTICTSFTGSDYTDYIKETDRYPRHHYTWAATLLAQNTLPDDINVIIVEYTWFPTIIYRAPVTPTTSDDERYVINQKLDQKNTCSDLISNKKLYIAYKKR